MGDARAKVSGAHRDAEREKDATSLRSVRTGRRAIRRIGYKTETLRSGGPAEERPERAGYHQRTIGDYKRSLEDVRTGPTAAFLRSAESLRTTN